MQIFQQIITALTTLILILSAQVNNVATNFLPRNQLASVAGELAPPLTARIYQVGSDKLYKSFVGLPKLYPGDVVEVYPGVYNEVKVWQDSGTSERPIIIRGIGAAKPVIDAKGFKFTRGAFQIEGSNIIVENFEFIHAHNGDLNAAGIRVYNGTNVTIRNNYLHDNDWGIGTSGDLTDNLLIEYNDIGFNASGELSHNLYLAGGQRVRLQYNYIHDSQSGQNLKIRMRYAEVYYNYISDSRDGEVEIIQQGTITDAPNSNAVLVGNVIVSQASRSNRSRFINLGTDDSTKPHRNGTLYLFNNTLIAGTGEISFIAVGNVNASTVPSVSVVAKNNIFYGSNNILRDRSLEDAVKWKASVNISGSNNWFPTSAIIPMGMQSPTNIIGADPGFQNLAGRWYELILNSTARGKATASLTAVDGAGNAFSVTPQLEYIKHLSANPRANDGSLDIGAYEFGSVLQNPDVSPPTAPSNVVAVPIYPSTIKVTWTGSTDNTVVAGYRILRPYLIGSSATTEFINDIYAVPGRTYSFVIQAYDAAGNISSLSVPSSPLIMPDLSDTGPPVMSDGKIILNGEQPLLIITTNEVANCKFSQTPEVPYISMGSSFVSTGGLTHVGIPTNYVFGRNNTYYIKCLDRKNNITLADTIVNSSLESTVINPPAPTPPSPPTPTPAPISADLNHDGVVNSLDYSLLNRKWNLTTNVSLLDINQDGKIDNQDLIILKAKWLKSGD